MDASELERMFMIATLRFENMMLELEQQQKEEQDAQTQDLPVSNEQQPAGVSQDIQHNAPGDITSQPGSLPVQ